MDQRSNSVVLRGEAVVLKDKVIPVVNGQQVGEQSQLVDGLAPVGDRVPAPQGQGILHEVLS